MWWLPFNFIIGYKVQIFESKTKEILVNFKSTKPVKCKIIEMPIPRYYLTIGLKTLVITNRVKD